MPISQPWVESWTKDFIVRRAPEKPGIYEIGGNVAHQDSDILHIGGSEESVMSRLLDHKRKGMPGASKFRYKALGSLALFQRLTTSPRDLELDHLSRFEDRHGDTPFHNQ